MARRNNSSSRGWVKIDDDISVIGDSKRFSLSIEIDKDLKFGFNGLKVVNGRNGDFISSPAWKDKDGNYHNYAFLQMPAEMEDAIIKAVREND